MKPVSLCLALTLLLAGIPAFADDIEMKAGEAVANVLFDFDGSNEFVSYVVRPDGYVDAVSPATRPTRFTRLLKKSVQGLFQLASARRMSASRSGNQTLVCLISDAAHPCGALTGC